MGKLPAATGRKIVTLERTVRRGDPSQALEFLARHTDLPKQRIKDAMRKGAVWIQRCGRRLARLRRVTSALDPGDRIAFYFDSMVLAAQPSAPTLLRDFTRYSAWYKPPGLLVEGSRFGDHATLIRQVELHFEQKRPVFLVHRLDREAAGVILIAHSPQAAARLSALFRERQVEKEYWVEVQGDLRTHGERGCIELPLDGKPSSTDYEVIEYVAARGATQVRVYMQTGRYHQIRQHFAQIGFPVMGDPKYGRGNADPRGMQLVASNLRFTCPWTAQSIALRAPRSLLLRDFVVAQPNAGQSSPPPGR